MPANPEQSQFATHFGFLEKEYGFHIQHKAEQYWDFYIATTEKCSLRITMPYASHRTNINIQPAGDVKKELEANGIRTSSVDIAKIALCKDLNLKLPEWWEIGPPNFDVATLGMYLKTHCHQMLMGDFSEWPELNDRLSEMTLQWADKFEKNYQKCGYEIVEQGGKYGLNHNRVPVFEPIFTKIEITNHDSNDYTLADFQDNPSVVSVREYNYPIVTADGKCGLLTGSVVWLPLEYERIIKLTYEHYLCQQKNGIFILVDVSDTEHPLAKFKVSGQITLDKLLQVLEKEHQPAYAHLRKLLKNEGNQYYSEYRRYVGEQEFDDRYTHYFTAGITKRMIDDDFCVSPG